MSYIFIDSCIVIDFINGKADIKSFDNYCFNSIVDMEVIIGARNKRDLNTTNKKLSFFNCIDINQEIINLSRDLVEKYSLSHGMAIYDAIIAATCLIYDIELWTYNKKDFKYIYGLKLVDC